MPLGALRRGLIALSCTLTLPGAAWAADLGEHANLFFIKRNKNANEVHYDALVENCTWRQPELDYYWRDLEEGPDVVSEIMFWEPPAYGFEVERSSDVEIRVRLNALPERAVTARLSRNAAGGCEVSTEIGIGKQTAELVAVYVFAKENVLGLPSVQYIDILGRLDGAPVFERIPQSDWGRQQAGGRPDAAHWKSGVTRWGRQ